MWQVYMFQKHCIKKNKFNHYKKFSKQRTFLNKKNHALQTCENNSRNYT